MIPYGNRVRRNGQLEIPDQGVKTRLIDFGNGSISATRMTWGDGFTAYYSNGANFVLECEGVTREDLE